MLLISRFSIFLFLVACCDHNLRWISVFELYYRAFEPIDHIKWGEVNITEQAFVSQLLGLFASAFV